MQKPNRWVLSLLAFAMSGLADAQTRGIAINLDNEQIALDLEALLDNPEIISRQKFLDALPVQLFSTSRHVLMHTTGSPCQSDVSPTYPRVILTTGNFFIAYTGKPDGICANTIEVVRKSPRAAFVIDYPADGGRPTVKTLTPDPQGGEPTSTKTTYLASGEKVHAPTTMNCTRCHGNDLKLIWGPSSPNIWPGAYGKNAGVVMPNSQEAKELDNFIEHSAATPAYARLQGYRDRKSAYNTRSPRGGLFRSVSNSAALVNFDFLAPNSIPVEKFHLPRPKEALRAIAGIPQSCIRCHASDEAEGGYLPFENEEKMILLLNQDGGVHYRALLNAVTSRDKTERMPRPPERPLNDTELQDFRATLLRLAPTQRPPSSELDSSARTH